MQSPSDQFDQFEKRGLQARSQTFSHQQQGSEPPSAPPEQMQSIPGHPPPPAPGQNVVNQGQGGPPMSGPNGAEGLQPMQLDGNGQGLMPPTAQQFYPYMTHHSMVPQDFQHPMPPPKPSMLQNLSARVWGPSQQQPPFDPAYAQRQGQYQYGPQDIPHLLQEYQKEKASALRRQARYEREKAKVQQLESQLSRLKKDYEEATTRESGLRSENEQFRTQIVTVASAHGPVRDEDYYSHSFEQLNGVVEHEVVKLSKAHANVTLSETEQAEIRNLIFGLGQCGVQSAEFLNGQYSLQRLYENGRSRHPLIRHIVAMFLFDCVLYPFAFGISQDFSDGLRFVQKQIVDQEPQFVNALMIHQAIGRGLLRFTEDKIAPREVEITDQLTKILQLLLPRSTEVAVLTAANKIVSRAIVLKSAMTEEHTLYECFWINCGADFNDVHTDVDDEEPTGRVLMCTFPGLARLLRMGKEQTLVTVIKASAIMKNSS